MTRSDDKAYAQRWWILGTLLISIWVGTLLNSMMPVALPSMLTQFDVGLSLGIWVITVYTLLFALLNPLFGWMGDRYGFRRIYLTGVIGHILSSWAVALAPSFGLLIAFRTLQGIISAMIFPSVIGIISRVFPKQERGVALGLWGAVNGGAHGLGPVISGFLVQNFSWRATFWVAGATAILALALASRLIPFDRRHDARPFDLLGAGALALAALTFMFALTQGSKLGWGSWMSVGLWGAFAALLILFVATEARVAHPFVELRLFANRRYTALVAVISAQFFCLMSLPILLSLYLIELRGFATGVAGLVIAVLASTLAVFSPLAGRAADRLGYRTTIIAGMAMVTVAAGSMLLWNASTSLWVIGPTLVVTGLGMGFTQSPAVMGITLVVREDELGVAMGISHMLRFLNGTLGATLFAILLEHAQTSGANPLRGFHSSFYLLTAVAAVAVLLAVSMPRPPVAVTAAAD